MSILDTLGGPSEKARADEIFKRVHTVADSPSPRAMNLKTSAKVKERSKVCAERQGFMSPAKSHLPVIYEP